MGIQSSPSKSDTYLCTALVDSSTNQRARNIPNRVWLKRRAVPTILHASVDSREVGLKHYELILDTTTRLGLSSLSRPSFNKRKKPAYVDLARDILAIKSRFYIRAFLEATPETILNRIHYFVYYCSYGSTYERSELRHLMKGLPALEGLAVINDGTLGVELWHKMTLDFFTKLKNDGETVPKIRIFGYEKDFREALQNKKL